MLCVCLYQAGRAAVRATLRAHAVHWPGLAAHTHPPSRALQLPALLPAGAPPRSRGGCIAWEESPLKPALKSGRGAPLEAAEAAGAGEGEAATREVGGVTRELVNSLPDFAHVLPADYRSGYMAWRCGKPRGAKGEARARGGGGGGGGGGEGGIVPLPPASPRLAYPHLARAI